MLRNTDLALRTRTQVRIQASKQQKLLNRKDKIKRKGQRIQNTLALIGKNKLTTGLRQVSGMLQNGEFGKLKKKRPQGDLLQSRMKSMSNVKKKKKEKKRKKRPSLMIIRDPSTTTTKEITKQSQEEKRKEAARKIREFEQSGKIRLAKQPPRKQARKGSSSLSFLNQKNLDNVKSAKSRHVNSYVLKKTQSECKEHQHSSRIQQVQQRENRSCAQGYESYRCARGGG